MVKSVRVKALEIPLKEFCFKQTLSRGLISVEKLFSCIKLIQILFLTNSTRATNWKYYYFWNFSSLLFSASRKQIKLRRARFIEVDCATTCEISANPVMKLKSIVKLNSTREFEVLSREIWNSTVMTLIRSFVHLPEMLKHAHESNWPTRCERPLCDDLNEISTCCTLSACSLIHFTRTRYFSARVLAK